MSRHHDYSQEGNYTPVLRLFIMSCEVTIPKMTTEYQVVSIILINANIGNELGPRTSYNCNLICQQTTSVRIRNMSSNLR